MQRIAVGALPAPMVLPVQRASASASAAAPVPGFTAAAPRSAFTVQRNDAPAPVPAPARAATSAATSTSTSTSTQTSGSASKDKEEAKDKGAEFDARKLSDGQLDELTHRLISPLTRLLRAELRLDRERIGRLRDPRR